MPPNEIPIAQTKHPTTIGFNPWANSLIPINFKPNNNAKVPKISLLRLAHLDEIDGEVAKTPNLTFLSFVLDQWGK